jgi:recombinational DNA repair ATPase RecF
VTLQSLSLQNFRNHPDLSLTFPPQTTLILGPNGSGKTNILEAICLLSTGKSFRADRQEEMINYTADLARVRGVVSGESSLRGLRQTHDAAIPSGTATTPAFKEKLQSNQNLRKNPAGDSSSPDSHRGPLNDGVTPAGAPPPGEDQDDGRIELEILITRGQLNGRRVPPKKYLVNGVSKLRKNFLGHLPAVLFGPQDLRLIDGSPSRRRNFLDQLLSQVSWEYRRCLLSYEQGLRQRNQLLLAIKDGRAHPQQLLFWNQLLLKNGRLLTDSRQQFADFLNQFTPGQQELSAFQIAYHPSPLTQARLAQYSARELAAGSTLIGPHRDDFTVQIANPPVRHSEATIKSSSSTVAEESPEKKQSLQSSSSVIQRATPSNFNHHRSTKNLSQTPPSDSTPDSFRDLHRFGSRGEQRLAVLWLKLGELAFIQNQSSDLPLLLLDDIFSELDHPRRQLIYPVINHQQTLITAADEHLIKGVNATLIKL